MSRLHAVAAKSILLLLLLLLLPSVALAEAHVSGEITVDGRKIAVATGHAFTQTGSSDDPVTWVRLTEKPGGSEMKFDGEAFGGRLGAFAGFHLHASGKLKQAIAIHPAADPNFPTDIPVESVEVTNVKVAKGEISATVATKGELKIDGHSWKFRFEFRLPIETQ